MASFTPEEIDFLRSHGNEVYLLSERWKEFDKKTLNTVLQISVYHVCKSAHKQLNKKVYLGMYDGRSLPEPDSRDEQRIKDFMIQKYDNKRWYVAPTDAMKEEAKWASEAALNSKPQVRPLRSFLGENATKAAARSSQTAPTNHAPIQVSVPLPGAFASPAPAGTQARIPATTAFSSASSGFDFLEDLGGNPFASTAAASNGSGNVDGFADFSNFDNMNSSPSHQPTITTTAHAPPMVLASQAFPVSTTPLQPSAGGKAPTPTTSHQPPAQSLFLSGDKYAALADLESVFSTPVTTTAAPITWGGAQGGSINWGGTSSTAGTPSQSAGGGSWTITSVPSGPINWNSQGSAGLSTGATAPSSGFGVSSAAVNPFGGVPGAGLSPFSGAAPTSTVNPFGGSAPATHFSQTGMPATAGYGGQFAVPRHPVGFGPYPVTQNGGFGMNSATAGYGVPGSFTQQQFMMPAQTAGVVHQAGGWGHLGSAPTSQPASNPFMNTGMPQQVPPPSGSTNPFL